MPARWTGPAGIHRRYGDQPASVPRQFVFQLTPELSPALIEDGSIQAGFGAHVRARTFKIARRRARHVVYPKVLDTHARVVFADHGRGRASTQSGTPGGEFALIDIRSLFASSMKSNSTWTLASKPITNTEKMT